MFSFGVRMPYNRVANGILSFLRDVSEPFLRLFRRIIPMVGPLDLSPIVAIFVLQIGGTIIADAVSNALSVAVGGLGPRARHGRRRGRAPTS